MWNITKESEVRGDVIRALRPSKAAAFNRRMRKTARPVVWEGWRAQSRHPDPIGVAANRRSPHNS